MTNEAFERVEIRGSLELACWTMVLLFPLLYWLNGPAVSSDQLLMRAALVVLAVGGAAGSRIAKWRTRRRADGSTGVAAGSAAEPVAADAIAAGPAKVMRWRRVPRGLAAALVVALVLRVPYLTQRSLWYDEASSWQTAKFSAGEMFQSLRLNVHPPLYYWVLKGWMAAFGESVLALRSLSVLFGLLTVAGMYLVVCQWRRCSPARGADAGELATAVAMLVAVSAFQINASIETRMYALGTALAAFSVWALYRIMEAPGSRRRWAVYLGLCVLLTYTHHYCLFIVASQFLFLLGYALWSARPLAARAVAVMLLVAVAYVPGALLLREQLGRVSEDYWTVPLSTDLVARTFLEFISPVTGLQDLKFWGTLSLAAFGGAAVLVARRAGRAELLVLAVAIVPMMLAGGVSLLVSPVWEGRFFRFSHPFLLFLLALAAQQFDRPAARRLALAVLVLGLTAASADFWRSRQIPARPGMAGAIARVMDMHNGRDPIVANSKLHHYPAKYYARGRAPTFILSSSTEQFWGNHLIRSEDVASDEQFRTWLHDGVWFLSHSPVPAGVDMLRDAIVVHHFTSTFDAGVPPWPVHVSYVQLTCEEARIAAAIQRVRVGAVTQVDLGGVGQLDPYLRQLAELDGLQHLWLDGAAVEDRHLEQLATLPGLLSLSLIGTQITDAALGALAPLEQLQRLDLDSTQIGDSGLQSVAAMGSLRELSLAGTRVTDAGLSQLATLDQLQCLVLDNTAVSDQGLPALANLPELAHLHVDGAAITEAGATRLRRSLPELRIYGTFFEGTTR